MPEYPSMIEEWRTAVRRDIGDGHERFTDSDIDRAIGSFQTDHPAPKSVARRLLRNYVTGADFA